MKAPLSWIKDYVDISGYTVDELKNKLFSCGFEVEDVIYIGKNINKIVVCRVENLSRHPNADKLTVCQVDAGTYGKLQIITAATNLFEGALVPVALDGSTLANGEKIHKGKLRGLESYGMFCSGEELEITDAFYPGASVNGILILKEDYPLGAEVKEVLGIGDVIFDINVTANRPDCQSILGLAREFAAVLGRKVKLPETSFNAQKSLSIDEKLSVEVKDAELCPRYMAGYVYGVNIAPSPEHIRKRLFSVGVNSINNIVDITNFVLYEIGQPMHAFDYRCLAGGKIIVRRATDGETITTLDEKQFKLSAENLVICDAEKPSALAGIMGGLNSEIEDDTQSVVFESAKFKRDNIRKSSRALGQRSDSSARFEKGVDAFSTDYALRRAFHLVEECGAGKIASGIIDVLNEDTAPRTVVCSVKRIEKLLGITIPTEDIKRILTALEFGVTLDGDNLSVVVPPYRDDIDGYQDIAEELIRMYGYDHIGSTLLESAAITDGGKNSDQRNSDKFKQAFTAQGFNEILTYSFYSAKEYELFGIPTDGNYIRLMNPLGEDFSVMRTTLLPAMAHTIVKNINRKNESGRLFEIANIYIPKQLPLTELPDEKNVLCVGMFGGDDFFALKGCIENALTALNTSGELKYLPSNRAYMHPTRSAEVTLGGAPLGYMGELNPVVLEKLGTDKRVYVAELDYDLLSAQFGKRPKFKAISKFPSVQRDLAFTVDDAVTNEQVIACIKASGTKALGSVELFDVYKGDQVEKGKKSMAYSLTFTNLERTLAVEEVDTFIGKILAALKRDCGADIRE